MGYFYLSMTIITTIISQLVIRWRVLTFVSKMLFPEDWIGRFFFLLRVVFDPFIFIALCLTFISGLCWIATMTKFEISYAYPFTMLGFVSIILLSTFLFGESVNFYKLIGCAIIVIGVVVTSLGL